MLNLLLQLLTTQLCIAEVHLVNSDRIPTYRSWRPCRVVGFQPSAEPRSPLDERYGIVQLECEGFPSSPVSGTQSNHHLLTREIVGITTMDCPEPGLDE